VHTVRSGFPSRAHCRAALRSRLFQADHLYFKVSNICFCSPRVPFDHKLEISVILVVATVLTAECKEYWQLLLCQGLLTGFACGMTLCPILAIVAQWFKKRRSLASGIVSAGASLGGTVIPIVARNLIDLVGYVSLIRNMANRFLQIQMDDASHRPHRTLHARDCQLGKDFHIKLSRRLLSSIASRLSDEDSILLGRPAPSSHGTISRNLRSMSTSFVVSLVSWVSLQVGCTSLSPPLLRD